MKTNVVLPMVMLAIGAGCSGDNSPALDATLKRASSGFSAALTGDRLGGVAVHGSKVFATGALDKSTIVNLFMLDLATESKATHESQGGRGLAIWDDGRTLATHSSSVVEIWQVTSGGWELTDKYSPALLPKARIRCVRFLSKNEILLVTTNRLIRLRTSDGSHAAILKSDNYLVDFIILDSPNGNRAFVLSYPKGKRTHYVHSLDLASKTVKELAKSTKIGMYSINLSPNKQLICITGWGGQVFQIEGERLKLICEVELDWETTSAAFTADSKHVFLAGGYSKLEGCVEVWRIRDKKRRAVLNGPSFVSHIRSLANGDVALASNDGLIQIRSLKFDHKP